jgi:hypothetical protein
MFVSIFFWKFSCTENLNVGRIWVPWELRAEKVKMDHKVYDLESDGFLLSWWLDRFYVHVDFGRFSQKRFSHKLVEKLSTRSWKKKLKQTSPTSFGDILACKTQWFCDSCLLGGAVESPPDRLWACKQLLFGVLTCVVDLLQNVNLTVEEGDRCGKSSTTWKMNVETEPCVASTRWGFVRLALNPYGLSEIVWV